MPMVKMRPTYTMPAKMRQKYATRALTAGDEVFEVSASDARILTKTKWAEAISDDAVSSEPKRVGRPRAQATEPEPAPQPEGLEALTRAELLELAEKKELELPSGYVAKDQLIELLDQAEVSD